MSVCGPGLYPRSKNKHLKKTFLTGTNNADTGMAYVATVNAVFNFGCMCP